MDWRGPKSWCTVPDHMRRLLTIGAAVLAAGTILGAPRSARAEEECHDCVPDAPREPEHAEPETDPKPAKGEEKAPSKKAESKKAPSEKAEPKKAQSKKAPSKKAPSKKAEPKKAPSEKSEEAEPDTRAEKAKRAEPKKAEEPAAHHHHEHEEDGDAPASRDDRSVDIDISSADIRRAIRKDLGSLGSMSVGRPQQGALVNPKRFPEGKHWHLMSPGNAYATEETIDYLTRAVEKVHATIPGGHPLYIGDISSHHGGSLKGHKSHQAGRDVDISFFYRATKNKPVRWYRVADAETLDVGRTWVFVKALLIETDVKFIFINTSVQKLLKDHALEVGEDPEWLDRVFQYDSKDPWPIIRHSPGHDTHIHIRFYNPRAQEMGRRAYGHLVGAGVIKPHIYYTHYTAKKGDILGRIAKRFDCKVQDIVEANKISGSKILAGKTYRIPREGNVHQIGRVKIPPRRLPAPRGTSGKHAHASGK